MSHIQSRPIPWVLGFTIAALLLGLLPPASAQDPGEGSAPAAPAIATDRLEGDSRFGTAAAVVRDAFDRADVVYVAPGGQFGYALAGGPRALRDDAPILLTDGARVPAETAAELERLSPEEIVVLGGTDVVPDAAATALAAHGTVRRITGVGATETAAAIAVDGWPSGADLVYLATSRDFPDALAGGVAAALGDAPILLTDATYLPTETADALRRLDPDAVRLLGGTAAISEDVGLQVEQVTDAVVGRLAGPGRIETALAITGAVSPTGETVDTVWISTAGNFPDAMAATPAIAGGRDALVLTRQGCLPIAVRDEIARLAPQRLVVLGGQAAVSEAAAALTTCEQLPPLPTFEVLEDQQPPPPLAPVGDSGPRPIAELIDEDGTPTPIVADEVMVSAPDDEAFQRWLDEQGGEVLQTIPPAGLLPTSHLVRLPSSTGSFSQQELDDLGAELQWINGVATGHHQVTSPVLLETLATATTAVGDGMAVALNPVVAPSDVGDGEVTETSSLNGLERSSNPFTWNQFARTGMPGIGTAEAWRLLAANDRLDTEVTMMVIDSGFARTYPDYRDGLEGDGAPNPDCAPTADGCRWHGTYVTSTATGALDNAWGTAGTAGPVPTRVLQRQMGGDLVTSVGQAIVDLTVFGFPDIINMSFGGSVPAIVEPFIKPLHTLTLGVHLVGGSVLVAAAGNERTDVNREDCIPLTDVCWEERLYFPCELDGVYCVGGLRKGSRDRDPGSNFGREACDNAVCGVKMFAPYTVLLGGSPDGSDGLQERTGTSYAAPYVAGVFALLRAADPDLGAQGLIALLNQTAHPSPHPEVGRVVNAYGAVLTALGPDAIIPEGPNRTPSRFPQDPVPAAGFSSGLSTDEGTLRGDGTTPATAPTVRWVSSIAGVDHWNEAPFAGMPVLARDALVMPVVDPSVPERTIYEMSLVGLDVRSGGRRWKFDDIAAGCPPAVGRDGMLWAVRGRNETSLENWSYSLIGIDPSTGLVKRTFSVPLDSREGEGEGGARLAIRDCDGHPLRMSPDGTRLLMWQGQKLGHARHSALRILDITAPDIVETAYVVMDGVADGGAGSEFNPDNDWIPDMRVSADLPIVYLLERDGGADETDILDDVWHLHALDLAGLPRNAVMSDHVRSVVVPVGLPDVAAWNLIGRDIVVAGEEEGSGQRRPGDGGARISSRRFRITDDGTRLRVATTVVRRFELGPERNEVIGVGPDDQLVSVIDNFRVIGLDRSTLARTWEAPAGTLDGPTYGSLLVDAGGNAVFAGPFAETLESVTPAGASRWSFALRGDEAVHPFDSPLGPTTFDMREVERIRLAVVTAGGEVILTGVDERGMTVVALG